MSAEKEASYRELLSLVDVDLLTGRVVWRTPTKYHPRMLNAEAGSARAAAAGEKRYWVIKHRRVAHKRARLVFLAANGYLPALVDHANRDTLDDRACNLREATVLQNAWNHPPHKKKSRLAPGVRAMNGRFQARIGFNGQSYYLGAFDTERDAAQAYQRKRAELYGVFA